jgi:hypothetical protein
MHSYNIFYSWQAEIRDIGSILDKAIQRTVTNMRKKYKINYCRSITEKMSGSPSIMDVTLNGIKKCDIYIADLSTVATLNGRNQTNCSVSFELGYAKSFLYDENIITLCDDDPEKLFFDTRQYRVTQYKIKDNKALYRDGSPLEKKLEEFILLCMTSSAKIRIFEKYDYRCLCCLNKNDRYHLQIYPDRVINTNENNRYMIICTACETYLNRFFSVDIMSFYDRHLINYKKSIHKLFDILISKNVVNETKIMNFKKILKGNNESKYEHYYEIDEIKNEIVNICGINDTPFDSETLQEIEAIKKSVLITDYYEDYSSEKHAEFIKNKLMSKWWIKTCNTYDQYYVMYLLKKCSESKMSNIFDLSDYHIVLHELIAMYWKNGLRINDGTISKYIANEFFKHSVYYMSMKFKVDKNDNLYYFFNISVLCFSMANEINKLKIIDSLYHLNTKLKIDDDIYDDIITQIIDCGYEIENYDGMSSLSSTLNQKCDKYIREKYNLDIGSLPEHLFKIMN